ncbi:biopolymer transporter ExbD [bacterium]|nr:biopolymer transporter ExbD [bacterium]
MKKLRDVHESNDMTSMVDVTFLLLIFFVVTASFVTTQAIKTDPAELASSNPTEVVPKKSVRVIVDEHDQFYVEADGVEEAVNTPRELRDALRHALTEKNAEVTAIDAHVNSHHSAVVQVCDASRCVGLGQIKVNPYK